MIMIVSDYDFRALSPIDFEVFVRDLVNAHLGLEMVTFAIGPDGGIDLRDSKANNLPSIAQCKHRPAASKGALTAAAAKEAEKLKDTRMALYLFITSAAVSPEAEEEIRAELAYLDAGEIQVWHRGKINEVLFKNPRVEESHFKLWLSSSNALRRLIRGSEWKRSEELVRRVVERARLYVHTSAYGQALKILEDTDAVIITGSPGVGKSTLAEMLLLGHWRDGWRVANITSNVDEAWRQMRDDDEKTIFFYDDFLGQASTAELHRKEGGGISGLMSIVRRNRGRFRIILTSREQLFGAATNGGDDRLREMANDASKISISLSSISRQARAEMLFNHLYFSFGNQEDRSRLAVDTRYRAVVDHKAFNPRILESIVLLRKHDNIDQFYGALLEALNNPDLIWAGSFNQLPRIAVDILLQLASDPTEMVEIQGLRRSIAVPDERQWIPALKTLESTWIHLNPATGEITSASLYDASRRDFLLKRIDEPQYLQSLLGWLRNCGQVGYLLRLSGLMKDRLSDVPNEPRTGLRTSLQQHLVELDELIRSIAEKQSAEADRQESVRAIERQLSQGNGGVRGGARTWPLERKIERLDALIDLASIIFDLPIALPQSQDFLKRQLLALRESLSGNWFPYSPQFFRLSAYLATESGPTWALDTVCDLLEVAFENAEQASELLAYGGVPEWFREGSFKEVANDMLGVAIEREEEAIGQQSHDVELMQSMLDELYSVAYQLDFPANLDSLQEQIDEIKIDISERSGEGRWRSYRTTEQVDGTNEDLQILFQKLAEDNEKHEEYTE
ncbi:restriction endonuclease [Paenarthrobacter sp. NPDC089989]|uniref:nSTAND3 domain-containing NTPase n=1 Tax=unclassified Paenarthrobacter TaxID=2634190 RepID=UPI0037FA373E